MGTLIRDMEIIIAKRKEVKTVFVEGGQGMLKDDIVALFERLDFDVNNRRKQMTERLSLPNFDDHLEDVPMLLSFFFQKHFNELQLLDTTFAPKRISLVALLCLISDGWLDYPGSSSIRSRGRSFPPQPATRTMDNVVHDIVFRASTEDISFDECSRLCEKWIGSLSRPSEPQWSKYFFSKNEDDFVSILQVSQVWLELERCSAKLNELFATNPKPLASLGDFMEIIQEAGVRTEFGSPDSVFDDRAFAEAKLPKSGSKMKSLNRAGNLQCVFRISKDRGVFDVAFYQVKSSTFKSSVGLRHIAYLLRYPGKLMPAQTLYEVNCRDVQGTDTTTGSQILNNEDIGLDHTFDEGEQEEIEIVDASIRNKKQELALAQLNNEKRVKRLQDEIDVLESHRQKSYGLPGRRRFTSKQVSVTRQNVSKAIARALKVFKENNGELYKHLKHILPPQNAHYNYNPQKIPDWVLD